MRERSWEALGKKIEPRWNGERALGAQRALARRAARRRISTRAGLVVLLALLAVGVRWTFRQPAASQPSLVASGGMPSVVAVAPVLVTPLTPTTVVDPLPDRDGRGFVLRAGSARFVVTHDATRPCVVLAGNVTIDDIGTTFTVTESDDASVVVTVDEGRVRVRAAGADGVEVGAGERRVFPVAGKPDAGLAPTVGTTPSVPATPAWKPLAESGRYDDAYSALQKSGESAVRDDTGDLLLAADSARLSGHPAASVPYLQRVLRSHRADPRAELAAFTLGRVLLDELGRPSEAADAFGQARAIGGPMAEDSLAREVEAYSRAGDKAKSRELADEYLKQYPQGQRTKAVSKFGGIE